MRFARPARLPFFFMAYLLCEPIRNTVRHDSQCTASKFFATAAVTHGPAYAPLSVGARNLVTARRFSCLRLHVLGLETCTCTSMWTGSVTGGGCAAMRVRCGASPEALLTAGHGKLP